RRGWRNFRAPDGDTVSPGKNNKPHAPVRNGSSPVLSAETHEGWLDCGAEEATERRAHPMAETEVQAANEEAGKLSIGDPQVDQGTATDVPLTAVLAGERAQQPAEQRQRDPSQPISVRELFEAGVHFGHQTKRWNPKMRQYIYGARGGIHIIDLDQTVRLFQRAFSFVSDTVSRGGHVLFVGTKRQAQDIVREEASRAGQYYVTNRWLGGTLTNFRTIKGGLERLRT